jgi:hypothetical protein
MAISGHNPGHPPKLYDALAEWFPLLTPPEDYVVESRIYQRIIEQPFAGGRRGSRPDLH